MKTYIYSCILFLLLACHSKPTEIELKSLNGYWEIDYVEFPDDNKKEYPNNEFVDLYEIKNKKGYKTKVKPQFDGKLLIAPIKDQIQIIDSSNSVYLKTISKYTTFSDEIIEINQQKLIIKNNANIKYYYKKYFAK